MPQLLSLRAYGRSRRARGLPGGSLAAVQKAIAQGRITPIDGKVDPEVADIQWAAKTDVVQQTRGQHGGHAPHEATVSGPSEAQPAATILPPGGRGGRDDYFAEKARREKVERELAELELAERCGKLVDREEVERAARRAAGSLVQQLSAIPDRIAAEFGADDAQRRALRQRLQQELDQVRGEFARAGFLEAA